MNSQIFETKPRWHGAPKICIAENLPSFASLENLAKFRHDNNPSGKARRIWKCDACDGWHYIAVAPDPTGDSSGTGRSQKGT